MSDPTLNTQIGKLSFRYGLLIGGISVVLSIVYFLMDPLLQFTNLWLTLLSAVIVIALLVVLGLDVRKKIGGFWNFGQAFQSLIIMCLFIIILSTVYSFILFKFVDSGLPQKVNDATEQVTVSRLEKMGVDQSKIDEYTKPFEDGEFKAKLAPTFKNELTNFGVALLIDAIICLIVAACIKKNPPMFAAIPDTDAG